MELANYIPDQNKFKLAGPSKGFLHQLWDFDQSLVVVPSRQGFYYRLAQRRKPNLPDHIVNEALFQQSDTQMLASYNLVPVTTILATANWSNPFLLEELRRRAPWRLGGSEQVIKELEGREAIEEGVKRARTDEHLTSLSADGFRLYKKKIGLRSQMWSPTVKAKPSFQSMPKGPGLKIGNIFVS